MSRYLTISSENQATITCPIFNNETKVAVCLKLRDLVMAGDRPSVRAGCQACMRAGKCPMANVFQSIAMSHNNSAPPDEYGSTEPVHIKLKLEHLARILPVIVTPAALAEYRPSLAEVAMIESSNERIQKLMISAPKSDPRSQPKMQIGAAQKRAKAEAVIEAVTIDTSITKAAATGDLSAAIS